MAILLVYPLLVSLPLREPFSIFRLLHDDLNACASCMQLIVDRVEELLGGVNGLARAALIVNCRGRVQGRGVATQLIVQRLSTLLSGALPLQRVLETCVCFNNFLVLSLQLSLLL